MTETAAARTGAPSLLALTPEETERRFVELGGRPFHARIARREVFAGGATEYDGMTSLPAGLRARLAAELPILTGRELERRVAPDEATKLLIGFERGEIETVHIPSRTPGKGATLCVSTQVGCPVACPFCASGRAGLQRNLGADEILEQVVRGARIGPLSRVVVMGIGEPLLNFESLRRALEVVRSEIGIGARKITVSTVGFPERLERVARETRGRPGFQLAISLHTPDDPQRDVLVPAMAGTPIERVLAAGDAWFERTGREVTYEYVLLGGVNDSVQHAERLAHRLAGRRATVNLIPYNPIGRAPIGGNPIGRAPIGGNPTGRAPLGGESTGAAQDVRAERDAAAFRRPGPGQVTRFQAVLTQAGIVATVRWSRGLEAAAACGQLRLRSLA